MTKYRGKSVHRKNHPKIFVWAHTERAEIEYFQDFKNHLKSALLLPKKSLCWDPWELIKKVIAWKEYDKLGKQEICEEDGDQIWCVFDVDDFYKSQPRIFFNAIIEAHNHNIKIAYVNECFELWVLMHLEQPTSPIPRKHFEKKIQQAFKKHELGNFEKNNKIFLPLLPFQEQAVKHAKVLLPEKYSEINWQEKLSSAGNPSTSVHFLIEEIRQKLLNI